jgi:hypothetical protein
MLLGTIKKISSYQATSAMSPFQHCGIDTALTKRYPTNAIWIELNCEITHSCPCVAPETPVTIMVPTSFKYLAIATIPLISAVSHPGTQQ